MTPELVGMIVGVTGEMELCEVCQREEPGGTLLRCGACGVCKHPRCAERDWTKIRAGPWHCRACKVRLFREGV